MTETKPLNLDSRIDSVTVYADRAEIKRIASIDLVKGQSALVFDSLPDSLDEKSLQVNGKGNAIITDVNLRKIFFSDIPNPEIKSLQDQKELQEQSKNELNDVLNGIRAEKKFIQDIATKLTQQNEKKENVELDPEKWIKMVDFYRQRLQNLDKEIREKQQSLKEIAKKIEKIDNELWVLNAGMNKTRNQVEVLLEITESSKIEIILSYMVMGPSWKPVYDLRVNGEKKSMQLGYNALIRQSTTENWEETQLYLSTARVNVSGQESTLAPWRVTEKIPPAPMLRAAMPVAYSSGMGKRKSKDDFAPEEMEIEEMAASVVEPAAQEDFFIQEAAVPETKTTSVVFRIPKKSAINCDNKEHRVSIILFEFAARFHYSSVPKLNPLAYLKAQVTNTTEYPLLEGPANVYFDNSFVATAQMQLVAPGEEFWTSLGIDEAIKIKRKFIKKYQSQEGVFTKTNKFIFEYLIEITNNKKTEEDIKITDQIPISGRDKIIVTLMKPEYKQDSESLKKNELNMVEWFFKMKASEKKSIPFQFSVEYPRDMRISGL